MKTRPASASPAAALALAVALLVAGPAAADAVRRQQLDAPVSVKLASAPPSWLAEDNLKRTSSLSPESWWGYDSSWNRYSYVENNPLNMVDPDGEFAVTATFIVVFTAAAMAAEWANTPTSSADPVLTDPQYENSNGGRMFAAGLKAAPFGIVADMMMPSHEPTPDLPDKPKSRTNKVSPSPEAEGPHTAFKTDQGGKVTGYTEYDAEGNPVKRFRGEGRPHGGVDPPLILEPKPGKGPGSPLKVPRKPREDEIPAGYQTS